MRRRELFLLAGTTILGPRAGAAQPAERLRRIGYLTAATGSPEDELGVRQTRALVDALRDLGWFDGRNISIEHRFSGAARARIQASAKELVALNPDVIVCVGGPRLAALLGETRTIPIVFTSVGDPVGGGFVASLAHPDGNVTGFVGREAALAGKQLQLLKEVAPSITRTLLITQTDNPAHLPMRDVAAQAAASVGVTLTVAAISNLSEVEQAVAAFAREPSGGLVVLFNAIVVDNQPAFHALVARYRLPAVYSYSIFAESGGLMSYGIDPIAQLRDAAGYVDKILRGAKPVDLPVQLPTRFVLAVNLKTAKALGLTVPQSLLSRADEVIE